MVSPVVIRPATVDDVDRLVALLWSVAAEGRWIGTEIPFDRAVRRVAMLDRLRAPSSSLLVAEAAVPGPYGRVEVEVEVKAAAGVVGNISVDVAPYGVARIGMLLAEGWRGRGIGTALLDAGLAEAVGAGAHKAELEVWPHNEAGLALYRRAGFVEEGRKRRHYRRANGELWDGILMGRPL